MIAKITKGKMVFGALKYNMDKVEQKTAQILDSRNMLLNASGEINMATCLWTFAPYLEANRRTEYPVFHVSLNPHPEDRMSDEKLSGIAAEYMERIGYGNQPYIVFKHSDTGREHFHIVSLRVDSSGRKINDYLERERSTALMKEFERKYELKPAMENPDTLGSVLKPVDYNVGNLKEQIRNVVRPVMQSYKFQNIKEYKALLERFNVTVEEVRKEVDGRTEFGIIYAALDNDGNRQGVAIKSSSIGKDVGGKALQNKYRKSKEWLSENPVPERTREWIRQTIKTSFDRKEFIGNLRAGNIDAVLFQNDTGRIYGVTYIDHNSESVFKGSVLGKEFSANALHMAFENSNTESNYHQQEDQAFDPGGRGNDLVGGILDIFNMESGGGTFEDFQQENEARRLIRKKKKKKQGIHL